MKKIIKLLLVLFLMFGLVACNEEKPPHEHNYFSEFLSDEEYHWQKCECGENFHEFRTKLHKNLTNST